MWACRVNFCLELVPFKPKHDRADWWRMRLFTSRLEVRAPFIYLHSIYPCIDCQCTLLKTFVIVGYPPPERGAHWRARGGAEGKRSDYSGERSGAGPGGTVTCSVWKTGTIFFMLVHCMLKDNPSFQPANSTPTLPTLFLQLNPCQSWSLNFIFPYVWDMKAHEITDYITTRKIWHR